MRALLLTLILPLALLAGPQDPEPVRGSAPLAVQRDDDLIISWNENAPSLHIPRGERLTFRVRVGVGGIGATVGTVTMESGVEAYRESVILLGNQDSASDEECGWLRVHAEGDYQLFSLDSTIEARLNPRRWPWIVYRFKQEGSKKRQREVLLGWRDEKPALGYRRDTDRNAPKGTRIWKDLRERELPVPALDMLSAAYYAREMIREDRLQLVYPVADKLDLWELRLRRGKTGRFETHAGTFEAVQILLDPQPYPGEAPDESAEEKAKTFEGLFGIHGSIELWVDKDTGVPLRVSGEIPVGPLNLSIDVVLKSYQGTPEAFRPLPE